MMQLMRHHGLGTLLDRPKSGPSFRKLLSMTVLATDMGVHAEFMRCFKEMVNAEVPIDLFRQKVLVCQALIKCADISNPVSGLILRDEKMLMRNAVSTAYCIAALGSRVGGGVDESAITGAASGFAHFGETLKGRIERGKGPGFLYRPLYISAARAHSFWHST